MKRVLQLLIRLYAAAISPFTVRSCRFHPTCSAYAHEAIGRHGALKGVWLAAKRNVLTWPVGIVGIIRRN